MGFAYLDHAADLAVRAWGPTLGEAFAEGARALFAAMVELESVRPATSRTFSVRGETPELALVEWLAALVAEKDTSGLVFARFNARVCVGSSETSVEATAWGERHDPARHDASCEVKGISLLGLRVHRDAGSWTVEYVADV